MHQIRSRPKDQSSDEEDSEKDQNLQPPISSVNRKNDEPKSVSTVHSIGKNDGKISDFSMFKMNQMKCERDGDKGIVMQCDALQRLGAALSVYATMNNNGDDDEIESEDPIFAEFVGSEYRVQFMEDFNHFMEKHQESNEEIKQEMMEMYGLKKCTAMKCELTTRHFRERRADMQTATPSKNVRSSFYRQNFDSLHFHIFHLEESGYRYRTKPKPKSKDNVVDEIESKTEDEENDGKAIDSGLQDEVTAINEGKEKCDFGRFHGDGPNKFTLSVSTKTWTDRMIEYVQSENVPNHIIEKAMDWLYRQGFDSDAIQLDVNKETVQSQECSVALHIGYEPLCKAIVKYTEKTKVSTFSVGLRFIYWEKCKGYSHNDFAENDDLFIDGHKYDNIKDELLNSRHCDMFAFNVLVSKCTELMLCNAVRKMTANTFGNERYGLKKGVPITIGHVQCVVAYCDLTDFSTAFSATFRAEFFGESFESIKKRNQCYFHVSKGLREAVECFGKQARDEKGPFYCGMNHLLLMTQFTIRLNGPTSTSRSRAVAIRFAGERGVVMQINNEIERTVTHLDCVPFSQFPEEDECLFMGGRFPLAVQSVLVMETAQNFSRFFSVLAVFDCVVSGADMKNLTYPSVKDQRKLQHLLKWCFGELKEEEITFPDFIYQTFECFRENKTKLLLDFYYIGQRMDILKVFWEPILHSVAKRGWKDTNDNKNTLKWNNVFTIFPNVKIVTIDCGLGSFVYGFPLTPFTRTVCEDVFPAYAELESVVVKGVPGSAMSAATAKMEEVASQCKSQLLTKGNYGSKTLILKRE